MLEVNIQVEGWGDEILPDPFPRVQWTVKLKVFLFQKPLEHSSLTVQNQVYKY